MSARDPFAEPAIAERTYKLGRRTLRATLHRPLRVRRWEWVAAFKVGGLDEECSGRAFGVDGLQALLLAAQALRMRMEKLALDFTWLGGEPRDTGIAPQIPTSFGLGFARRAQEVVAKELPKYVRSPEGRKARREERRRTAQRAEQRDA